MNKCPLIGWSTAALLALLAAIWASGSWAAATDTVPPDTRIALTGQVRIAMLDNPADPAPSDGSPAWKDHFLTEKGIQNHVQSEEGVGWALLRFTLAELPRSSNSALFITNPSEADETYLNGISIGGHGKISQEYITEPRGAGYLTFPTALLKVGENELTLRFLSTGKNMAVFRGPFLIGSVRSIQEGWSESRLAVVAVEAAFLSFFFGIFLSYAILVLKGAARSDYMLFMAFIVLNTAIFFLDSNVLQMTEFKIPFHSRLQVVFPALRILVMLSLVSQLAGRPRDFVFRAFFLLGAAYTVLSVVLTPMTSLYMLSTPYRYLLGAIGLYYLVVSFQAVVDRREGAIPLLIGIFTYVVASRTDVFLGTELRDYGVVVFSVSMLYALLSRHIRNNERLIAVSARLLEAHEEERKRLARDIHDGICQSLAGLKLNLQMLSLRSAKDDKTPREEIDKLTLMTGAIIDDARRAAQDLRPSFLENKTLQEAVTWYAESFLAGSGIEFIIHTDRGPIREPATRTKDGLYRIVQEILSNVVKHARATRVELSMHNSGDQLVVVVTDNGVGFDQAEVSSGLGLTTMSERAELLGGDCQVLSGPGKGTTVRIQVTDP